MLLLDTHALVWLASDQSQIPAQARRAIREQAGRLFVSSISALEIALLVKRRRLTLPLPPAEFLDRALARHGIEELQVDRRVALRSAGLPDLPNDPFDRILVATALERDLTILSRDDKLRAYPGVRAIWK
jgi:PIN domain nuclease of toxin-antitoxin system